MSNPNVHAFVEVVESIPPIPLPPGAEKTSTPPIGVEAAAIVKRKKRENMLKKCSLVLRLLCFLFSFLAFVIMVSNRHSQWNLNFEVKEEYSYVLAMGIISSVYSIYQGIREVIQLVNGKCIFPQQAFAIIDFIGDQILAYLLISAASAAVPITNNLRKKYINSPIIMKFLDMAAASISMAFFAFFTLALSVLISGYQLFAHLFISFSCHFLHHVP